MKKISALFIAGLIILCFSVSLDAQSSDKELDQVELLKQFVGIWKVGLGEDTTLIWEVIPLGVGYKEKLDFQAKGKSYSKTMGIIGFTWENKNITRYVLFPDGQMARLRGGYKAENKLYLERYTVWENKVLASYVYDIISPDKMTLTYTYKGMEESWDNAEVRKYKFARMKE